MDEEAELDVDRREQRRQGWEEGEEAESEKETSRRGASWRGE
jgi:hypothetical protein